MSRTQPIFKFDIQNNNILNLTNEEMKLASSRFKRKIQKLAKWHSHFVYYDKKKKSPENE